MSDKTPVQTAKEYIDDVIEYYHPSKSGTFWSAWCPAQRVITLPRIAKLNESDIVSLNDEKAQKFNAISIKSIVSSKIN